MTPPISVIIPMFNEADNVDPFIHEVYDNLIGQLTFEIIVIDDGSTDATLQKLRQLNEQMPELRILSHEKNYGQSAATVTGIRHATYPWIVTLDGDGQNDPKDILILTAKLPPACNDQRPILIAGNRQKRRDTTLRRLSSRVANGVRSTLLRDDCHDTGCSLKLFSKAIFLQMPHFNHLHRFIPSLIKRQGGHIINVPVNHRPRLRGTSKYGVMNRLWVGIIDLFGVMWLMRRPCNPEVEHDTH